MMKLPGKITISRPSYGDGTKKITITLNDESSGAEFLEVELDYAVFAVAITGGGYQPCEFMLRRNAPVGLVRETKTEIVERPNGYAEMTAEQITAALTPFEVDGWRGQASDLRNHHRWVKGQQASRVTFIRFVLPTPQAPE